MMETIHKLIHACKEGGSDMETPRFIDSMLRNYTSEDTVSGQEYRMVRGRGINCSLRVLHGIKYCIFSLLTMCNS